jgi:DNA (cytosine-5)-methyltransferase 1
VSETVNRRDNASNDRASESQASCQRSLFDKSHFTSDVRIVGLESEAPDPTCDSRMHRSDPAGYPGSGNAKTEMTVLGRLSPIRGGQVSSFADDESVVLCSSTRAFRREITRRVNSRARLKKIRRLNEGNSPRVLDLFAGCGGFSLGFAAAGFDIVGALEIDPLAAKSHALNFCKEANARQSEIHARPRDITRLEPEDIVRELSLGSVSGAVDVLIGGPPCQAFARVGRAKLREISSHPSAFLKDSRSNLYLRFLKYVERLQPLALVMENVPDALNYGGHNIAEETCEVLEEMGYAPRYTLLNSVFYGVPQMRERMFLVAYAKELGSDVHWPRPTHWIVLPRGYEGSRNVALKTVGGALFGDSYYVPPPQPTTERRPAVTARQALEDLPPIRLHLNGQLKRGARRFDSWLPYSNGASIGEYGHLMRTWPGFQSPKGLRDHVIRSLPRDYAIFRRMHPGDQYPQAFRHAMDLLNERLEEKVANGSAILPGSNSYRELRSQVVPPYDASKFPNKWRKMEADLPARTLMAHLGKDSYSHIHYDSSQARTISVREAARLQSFPDGFEFAGTMNPAFRQVGNAVPPLMAKAIAVEVLKDLKGQRA